MELRTEQNPITAAEAAEKEVSALVLRAQEGDAQAFGSLVELMQEKLHRQALFLAREEHQALDLLQETLVQVWKNISRYDGRVRFFTWVCSIMHHRHFDWLRRLRTRSFIVFGNVPKDTPGVFMTGIESAESDRALVMSECLDRLPSRQRMVIYLRFYTGESLEGIAAVAQCSVGTVKSRLFHGLARLAKMQKLKQLRLDETLS